MTYYHMCLQKGLVEKMHNLFSSNLEKAKIYNKIAQKFYIPVTQVLANQIGF